MTRPRPLEELATREQLQTIRRVVRRGVVLPPPRKTLEELIRELPAGDEE